MTNLENELRNCRHLGFSPKDLKKRAKHAAKEAKPWLLIPPLALPVFIAEMVNRLEVDLSTGRVFEIIDPAA